MKTLINVTIDENDVVAFKTDLTEKDIPNLPVLSGVLTFNMMTRLWGGNEKMVLAAIRNLAIADLAASANRKQMVKMLDQASEDTAEMMFATMDKMKKDGVNYHMFAPGVKPS